MGNDEVAAQGGAHGHEGDAHGGGLEGHGDGQVGVVLDAQGARFHRPAEIVAGAGDHIAHPGGLHPLHAAGADHLVEEHVGDRADEGKPALALPHDLVTGGKRDRRLQAETGRHGASVRDKPPDGVGKRDQLGCRHPLN